MRVKKILKIVLISAIVIAAAYFYSFVKKSSVCGVNKSDEMIHKDKAYSYSFVCEEDRLYGMKLNIASASEKYNTVRYNITDSEGTEMASGEINISAVTESHKITFDMIKDSKGKEYKIKFSSDNDKENPVVLAKESAYEYLYRGFRLETMIVSILCIAYLIGLAKVLNWIFRK